MVVLEVDAVTLILELFEAESKAIAVAPELFFFFIKGLRFFLKAADLSLRFGTGSLGSLELAKCGGFFCKEDTEGAGCELTLGIRGDGGVDGLEKVDVGVPFAGSIGEALVEAVEEELGALGADRMVDVGACGENVEEGGRSFHLVREGVLVLDMKRGVGVWLGAGVVTGAG